MPPADAIALPAAALGEALVEPPGTFEELVGEHQAMIFSLAWHTLRDRGLAEEVAQEAFLRLCGHLPNLKSRRHALFWLRQVACRLCIDELRRRPARAMASLEEVSEPRVDPPGGDLLLEEQLRRQVAALPLKARLAVVLRYQEDLEPGAIAELLQEPLPTVKSRLQRALAQLRAGLAGPEGGRRWVRTSWSSWFGRRSTPPIHPSFGSGPVHGSRAPMSSCAQPGSASNCSW
jgi:RNA polymerase sigma-70 factor (ECF subfamily)